MMRHLIIGLCVLLLALPVAAQEDNDEACDLTLVNNLLAQVRGVLSDGQDFQTALELIRETEAELIALNQICGGSLLLDATTIKARMGISVDYPSVWVLDGEDTDLIALGTSEAALEAINGSEPMMPEGEFAMGILSADDTIRGNDEIDSVEAVLDFLVNTIEVDGEYEVGERVVFSVNDREAMRVDISLDTVIIGLVVIEVTPDRYIAAILAAHPGELTQFAPTANAILQTIRPE
jgi:hypothetical protein